MIGVVLWSDQVDRKAVIWCEDQGDLAFFSPESDVLDRRDFFDAGDLVQFDMEVTPSMRRAINPRLVIEQVGSSLPDVLRQSTCPPNPKPAGAKIISLNRSCSETASAPDLARRSKA